jgi:hypothetical protein
MSFHDLYSFSAVTGELNSRKMSCVGQMAFIWEKEKCVWGFGWEI